MCSIVVELGVRIVSFIPASLLLSEQHRALQRVDQSTRKGREAFFFYEKCPYVEVKKIQYLISRFVLRLIHTTIKRIAESRITSSVGVTLTSRSL